MLIKNWKYDTTCRKILHLCEDNSFRSINVWCGVKKIRNKYKCWNCGKEAPEKLVFIYNMLK